MHAQVKTYAGDKAAVLDMDIVRKAIHDFKNSPEKTVGYGTDFGVLHNSQTTLIEWNDGFALGAYGLYKEIYTGLVMVRDIEANSI